MKNNLCLLRRSRNYSQAELAKRMETQLYRIQAAEYGLGHGGNKKRPPPNAFPTFDFFDRMSDATNSHPIKALMEAYEESCRLGDRQEFSPDELPVEVFSAIVSSKNLTCEELAQIAGLSLDTLETYVTGDQWCPRKALKSLGTALGAHPLRVETVLWKAHYKRTEYLVWRTGQPANRPARPTQTRSPSTV